MIFDTKFLQKRYFWPEREQVKITIEFSIFELVYVRNFNLNRQFWFFELNLPKKGNEAYHGSPRKCVHIWKFPRLISAGFSRNIRQKKSAHFKVPVLVNVAETIIFTNTSELCFMLWYLYKYYKFLLFEASTLLKKMQEFVQVLLGY